MTTEQKIKDQYKYLLSQEERCMDKLQAEHRIAGYCELSEVGKSLSKKIDYITMDQKRTIELYSKTFNVSFDEAFFKLES